MTLPQAIICSLAVLNAGLWGIYLGMKISGRHHAKLLQHTKDLAFKQGELKAWTESAQMLKRVLQ